MLLTPWETFPELTTERLILRQMNAADAAEMHRLRSDEEVMRYVDRPRTQDETDGLKLINYMLDLHEQREAINWAMTIKGDNTLVGNIGLFRFKKESYRAEVGYMLHTAYHRQGFASEALNAVLNYGFREMKLHSVEADVNATNKASMRLLEKNGFRQEAWFRENFYYNGQFLDSVVYGKLVTEHFKSN